MSKRDDIVYELHQLTTQHGGIVLPQKVVEFARDKDTALHGAFEWDDGEAAEKYRIQQARELLRVHVRMLLPNGRPGNIRAFVSLTEDRKNGGGYRPMIDVMGDAELRRRLVIDAIGELQAFERKYKNLTELSAVFEAARKLSKKTESVTEVAAQQA